MRVLICGGGVIGASLAYFLARRGAEVLVVERTGLACAASGKSGGFLALDWCEGTPLDGLARASFALHAELAGTLGGEAWGYRRLDTYGGYGGAGHDAGEPALPWLSRRVSVSRRLGTARSTAQVDPAAFTAAMMHAAQSHGAGLHLGQVTGMVREEGAAEVRGIVVDGEVVTGDAVVVAMGPWSILATPWLPLPGVFGLKGHSLLFATGADVPAQALFLEYEEPDGEVLTPELFPRRDGTTYVCAISSEPPLPLDPVDVAPDPGAIERLEAMCRALSPVLARAPVVARQACYRPVTRDGLPLIGRVPGLDNAYVATGHSVWGILNAPATGQAMADLILDGVSRTIDLAQFDPARLRPFDPTRLQLGSTR
ncbi:MAG: FAD-binding oxidoreductase [Alphaproteobacteria bacterium]|nr:FAD-binding oxidoreductase [Alphaproteobacteria bacterium]